jgi:hypothetical protein
MASGYGASNGKPECPEHDLGGFAPSGAPKELSDRNGAAVNVDVKAEAALRDIHASVTSKTTISEMIVDGKSASIPKEGGPGRSR